MKISIIVAMGKNRQIGINNKIPWRLKSDFKHFKESTMGSTLIMGRKTFESLPNKKPLPGRKTIVLTRNSLWKWPEDVLLSQNIYGALSLAWQLNTDAWICGGAEVYKEGLKIADELVISAVDWDGEADTYFPEFNELVWKPMSQTYYPTESTKDSLNWSLVKYKKRS